MSKIAIAANTMSLLAAGVGLAAAAFQYREVAEVRDISAQAQDRLQRSIATGNVRVEVVQAVIGDLGQITGQQPPPVVLAKVMANPKRDAPLQSPVVTTPYVVALSGEESGKDQEQAPRKLRLDEKIPVDLFGQGIMYTMEDVSEDSVRLVDATGMRDYLSVGRRMKVRGTKCSIDLLRTQKDESNTGKGWAEFRAWC